MNADINEFEVEIPGGRRTLHGILRLPAEAKGIVAFAHGSGSGRFSPRNQFVARHLENAGLATLLLDLLDEDEAGDREKVFDIELLANRLQCAADWLGQFEATARLPLGYFGASTGAGAALVAAARSPASVHAVVSRGGRPDLAGQDLSNVSTPTLLIVGGNDDVVVELNRQALRTLNCPKHLSIVPGATHLFEEPGTLAEVARLAADWFVRYLTSEEPDEAASPPRRFSTFRNREDAGRQLALVLKGRNLRDPLVLAIPRGGVVTGAALARELDADLDIVLSRKLPAPGQPELAIGAIAEDGSICLNQFADDVDESGREYIARESRRQFAEIRRRNSLFRAVRPNALITGRSVIITDDGIATGATMIAALKTVRAKNPDELIVAVPVSSPDRLEEIGQLCDEVVCLASPATFRSVGQYYDDFGQVEDDEVLRILRQFNNEPQTFSQ